MWDVTHNMQVELDNRIKNPMELSKYLRWRTQADTQKRFKLTKTKEDKQMTQLKLL
jgi:hypothetical protein